MHHAQAPVTPHLPKGKRKLQNSFDPLIPTIGRKAHSTPLVFSSPHAPRPLAVVAPPLASDGVRAVGGGEGAGAADGVGGGLGDGRPRGAPLGGGPRRSPARLGLAPALGSRARFRLRRPPSLPGVGSALRLGRILEVPAPRTPPRPSQPRHRHGDSGGAAVQGRRARVSILAVCSVKCLIFFPWSGSGRGGILVRQWIWLAVRL
jgi:hypothetical protein